MHACVRSCVRSYLWWGKGLIFELVYIHRDEKGNDNGYVNSVFNPPKLRIIHTLEYLVHPSHRANCLSFRLYVYPLPLSLFLSFFLSFFLLSPLPSLGLLSSTQSYARSAFSQHFKLILFFFCPPILLFFFTSDSPFRGKYCIIRDNLKSALYSLEYYLPYLLTQDKIASNYRSE